MNDPMLSAELKEALQTLAPDLERMVPSLPVKGKQGSYITYYCGSCHAGISSGSKFCYRCGRKVDLENSDIPAIKEDIVAELPDPQEEPEPEKKRRTGDNDMDGQSSIFDLLDE